MSNIKRLVALGLVGIMSLSMVACGKKNYEMGTDPRTITIGSWWRMYYDSSDENMEVSQDWNAAQFADDDDEATRAEKEVNQRVSQAKWDRVAYISETYNIDFYWQNLTYEGTKESINTSVLAGMPDCDVYLVDASIAIPAQANGLLVDLKDILPEDSDLFTDQTVFSFLDLGDGKACILQINGTFENTFPLGYNKQMIEAAGLEDPVALYEKGEWTWDKFLEYCQILTQDTDGDGQIDQYGYCGFANDTLNELLMSNGATICGGATETLTSVETGEVLEMFQKLYSPTYSYPYDPYSNGGNPSESMRFKYNEGNIAFFPISVWIQDQNYNYPMEDGVQGNLTWDTVYVHWPVGPSGNAETNAGFNASEGNFLVIPAGVEDPLRVYNFLYDLYNWYDGDLSFRDDPATVNWWYNETAKDEDIKAHNFVIQQECLSSPGLEMYDSLGISFSLEELIDGTVTPAQFQEMYKQEFQDALDRTFGN